MSHIAEIQTKIKTVNEALLRETIDLMCHAQPGLVCKNTIKDYGGKDIPVDASLFTPTLKRGLGMRYKTGNIVGGLEFVGDSFTVEAEYSTLQQTLLSTYQTLAVQYSLKQMEYDVTVASEGVNRNIVEAVRA